MKHAIPDDWDHETFCRFSICWPDSILWRALLRGLVTEPARGFFWDENTGSIRDVLADFRQTLDYNIELWEVIMACGDENIANALDAIAQALITASINAGNSGGGGGCECVNFSSPGSNVQMQTTIILSDGSRFPIFASGPLPTLPGSGFPEGYADQTEYDVDKCAKANKIISDLIDTLTNMSQLNLATGVIGAIVILSCIVGLITVPEATIPLLLFALTANIGITTALGLLAQYISNNRDDYVCILYTGDNIQTIIGLIADALDIAIALIPIEGPIAIAVKSIVLWLLNGDTLAGLLTSNAKQLYPAGDCSGCQSCLPRVYSGTGNFPQGGILLPEVQYTVNSVFNDVLNRYYIVFDVQPGCACEDWKLTVHSINGVTNDNGCLISNCAGQTIWRYNINGPVVAGDYCGNYWGICVSTTPVTAVVSFSQPC